VVEAPFALKAAGRFCHAPGGNQQSKNLPPGAVKILNVRKACKAEAGGKGSERKEYGTHERFLAHAEDQEEVMHNPSMYSGGAEG